MVFSNPYWSVKTRIELLQKWLIIHSIIYYELNDNIVSDEMFDNNSRQLVCLVANDRQAFEESKWYYVFKDFDGSSGFYLYRNLRREEQVVLLDLAKHILWQSRNWKG